jgi:hypothetical protein
MDADIGNHEGHREHEGNHQLSVEPRPEAGLWLVAYHVSLIAYHCSAAGRTRNRQWSMAGAHRFLAPQAPHPLIFAGLAPFFVDSTVISVDIAYWD